MSTVLPDVTILMPTYQGYSWLVNLLPVLQNQCLNYSGHVEILAVDSGSTDGTVNLLKQYGVTLIAIPNSRFSHGYARNLGVRNSTTPLIIFMSQDVFPVGDNWLTRLVHLLDNPKIGAAHIRQLPRPQATPLEEFFHLEMYPPADKLFTWKPSERMTLDKIFFSNVCSITHRELCVKFPFPENLIMSEDQIFAKSLLKAGYNTLYSASVVVIHSHHYTLKALFQRNFDSAYSLVEIAEDTFASTAQAGIRYIVHEVVFLAKRGKWLWLAYVPIYETTRIIARLLGGHADRLPIGLRTKFSLHRNFWTRVNTISP